MPDMSPQTMDAIAAQYGVTIMNLSTRLANAHANIVVLGEQIVALTAKNAELEKKLAGATVKKNKR